MRVTNIRHLAILSAGLAISADADATGWGKQRQSCPPRSAPCETIIESSPDASISPSEAAPTESAQDSAAAPIAPAPAPEDTSAFDQAMAGQYDVASASNISAPNMIGDFFGAGGISYVPSLDGTNDFVRDSFNSSNIIGIGPDAMIDVLNISPGTGGGVGRIKLAENTSILPQDRVFFGYNFFDNVPLAGNGTDVNRFVPGFEKTFFGGATSVEVRIPFAGTLDSNQNFDGLGATNIELGNVTLFFKALFYSSDTFAFGGGLTVTTPTADDLVVTDRFNNPVLKIENEGTHLAPYLGMIWSPGRFFSQLYFQYDVDATGRSAFLPSFQSSTPVFREAGKFTDTSVAFLDWNVGYWLYRNPASDGLIKGIAPVFEVHYNQALGNGDFITDNESVIADTNDNFSSVNLTFGSHFVLGNRSTLTLASGVPVTGDDRQFDYEFHVIFNYLFGKSANAYRYLPTNF